MKHLVFFIQHTIAHLGRERQRTLFVLFCITAGVAAVVALRTLGLMIDDALASNLQVANRGDMAIYVPSSMDDAEIALDRSLFEARDSGGLLRDQEIVLSASGIARLETWGEANGFEIMPTWNEFGPFTRIYQPGDNSAAGFAVMHFVEPDRYPFYGSVELTSPPKATLAQVLAEPYHIVISQNLARELALQVGDKVHLVRSVEPFTVAAVADPRSEASLSDVLGAVFPFIYAPYQTGVDVFDIRPNVYYAQLPAGTDVTAAKNAFLARFPGFEATTTEDLRLTNRQLSSTLTRLATIMGLASLLIGGIGIANTMIVVVSRRNIEIAVLKSIGARGSHIVAMFAIEALVLGAVGSALGVVLGLGLVFGLQELGERFVAQTLQFTLYPQAVGIGLALGTVVTLAFSALPTLAAAQVRPNTVLRPADAPLPRAGRGWTLLVVLGLTFALGIIVGQILGNTVTGLIAASGTIVALGLGTLVLRVLVWVLSRLPSFGSTSLKLAQRGIDAQKGRASSTMLALVIGMFALSLVLLLVQGTFKLLANTLEEWIGGNVLVAVQSLEVGKALEAKMATLPGVLSFEHDTVYEAEIVAINGDRDITSLVKEAEKAMDATLMNTGNDLDGFMTAFDMKVLEDDTWSYRVVQGKDIVPQDQRGVENERVLLEPSIYDDDHMFDWLGLKPGVTLTFRFAGGEERTATVAGITAKHESGILAVSNFRETYGIVLPGFVPANESPVPSFYALTVAQERMNETLTALAEVPGTFMVETNQMSVFAERLFDQFSSLPLAVAILALFASSTIIANSVSLATLERRRQIGVMKALGLQAERVLWLLLLENGLVGLAGGAIGIMLGVGILLEEKLLGEGVSNLPLGVLLLLIALALGLSLGATLLTAYGASREKPLNVLRYE